MAHHFLKPDRPRVKYILLKDHFIVPSYYISVIHPSYYISPITNLQWEKALHVSDSWHPSLWLGPTSLFLFYWTWHMVIFQMTQPHSPNWAAVLIGVWRGVPGRNAPTWSHLWFQSTGTELKVRDPCASFLSWRHYRIRTQSHAISHAGGTANIL